jgi:hypothetical protein
MGMSGAVGLQAAATQTVSRPILGAVARMIASDRGSQSAVSIVLVVGTETWDGRRRGASDGDSQSTADSAQCNIYVTICVHIVRALYFINFAFAYIVYSVKNCAFYRYGSVIANAIKLYFLLTHVTYI